MSIYRSFCPISIRYRMAPGGAALLLWFATTPLLADETNVVDVVLAAPIPANAVPLHIKNVIVWLGPVMFFFFLGLFNLIQTFRSKSGLETAAKVLVNCLGFILVFWVWGTFNIDHTRSIEAFLKSPPPQTGSAQIWCGVFSAAAMIGFLFALEALGDLTAGRNALQALTVFLTCIAIYLLAPLVTLLADTEGLLESRFYHIATGAVIGGVLYLIFLLFYLGTRKAKGKS